MYSWLPGANAFATAILIWGVTVLTAGAWLTSRWLVERAVERTECQCDRCQAARQPQRVASAHEIARDLVRRRQRERLSDKVDVDLRRHNLN